MSFYRNLKMILDEKGLSNYAAANICDINSQTIDNIIKNKVKKPKPETFNRFRREQRQTNVWSRLLRYTKFLFYIKKEEKGN